MAQIYHSQINLSQFFLLVFDFQVWTWCKTLVSTLVSVQLQLPLMAGSNSWGTSYDLPSQERTVKLPSRQRVSFIQVWTQKIALEMGDFSWKTTDFYHDCWFWDACNYLALNRSTQPRSLCSSRAPSRDLHLLKVEKGGRVSGSFPFIVVPSSNML